MPSLAHFPPELQIVLGTFGVSVPAAIGMLFAVLLTTAMFLWTLQRVLMGTPTEGGSARKLDRLEIGTLVPLAALILVLGLVPGPLVLIIQTALTRGPLAALARR